MGCGLDPQSPILNHQPEIAALFHWIYLALPNRCKGSLVVPLFFLSNRFENSRQEKFIFYMFIARDCLVRCRYLDFRGITFSQVLI